ncbi:MAG: MBL fold metallo-hydrolase [Candidatus Woesearchaeota archaeon]
MMNAFEIKKINEDIIFLKCNGFGSNISIIKQNEKYFLIDTSIDSFRNDLIKSLSKLNISPKNVKCIFNTHEHYDHIGNSLIFNNSLKYMSEKTPKDITKYSLGYDFETYPFSIERISEGNYFNFDVYLTPGHSSSGITLFYKNTLFCGDTLFERGIPRTDFINSSKKELLSSFKKLKKIVKNKKERILVLPGHGDSFYLDNHINESIKILKKMI